ncbi:glycerol-3-phosphate dehydrogenase (NAD(P)+) [Roseibium hamelinense]|uniref:Glycerol-3-phosphate dehydrogenase [NAD(P)+] n=1 Tax=Roseibium hamelinense TaxID=150831 RepID=A0A562SFB4_9HYPH|nr:NAD(P)H-dependent glycerol-3-phosphate dehydrogenase [Roseibium hamelinense]MTI42896.1 NAD(P)-dependent glycerol-3-phosphate dehydrogenase [Roseibium hamelinense]TWI79928.1 glycerol-3-phosphate dehydrogenase (NAD(P)+) [Roseibium hamelinense]
MQRIQSVGVIGGGAWGTALALTAARAGRKAILWARDANTVSDIRARQQNPRYLHGITFDEEIEATTVLTDLVSVDAVLLVTPAQTTRPMLQELSRLGAFKMPLLLCAKGFERQTGKLLSQIVSEELPGTPAGVLSGPSFAEDVAKGLPTAVTIAIDSQELGHALCLALAAPAFRPYASTDVVGTQIGGALKNVLAIACGAVAGRKLGASAQAALTARGFAELTRLGVAMDAKPETLTGLSGLGDLVLTCSSTQSRNFSFGKKLGEGHKAADLLLQSDKLAEGAFSARVALDIGRRHKVDLPICETVSRMIDGDLDVDEALTALMSRPLKPEASS